MQTKRRSIFKEVLTMKRIFCLLLTAALLFSLSACKKDGDPTQTTPDTAPATAPVTIPDTFPELDNNVTITCLEGTADCYSIDGDTILFTGLQADSIYTISGEWTGNIVIDPGDDYKFELEMHGFSLAGETVNPITALSGNEVTLTAKKDYENFIYDKREAVDSEEEGVYAGAIHAECDLTIGGKGSLTVISSHNNGIHTKDDLEVKNLTLTVSCVDNALKGNDSVEVNGGSINLIARQGDGIKTSNSDISEKGNQRGTVTLNACTLNIYAACDGIDAAYDVMIADASTVVNIHTDRYSEYSETVENNAGGPDENLYFIRYSGDTFQYAVKYYNSDDDYQWVVTEHHSTVSGGRTSYYYYSFPILSQYSKIQYFGYTSDQTPGQDQDYAFCTDYMTVNTAYDTFALMARGNSLSYYWDNYSTTVDEGMGGMGGPGGMGGGMGGMGEGNTDKGDYSTKGIKAGNAITIQEGTLNIRAYDDAIHANQDTTLENGESPLGNVTILGGTITVFSNDDGIHADGTLEISGGTVSVTGAYEGLEGSLVKVSGGDVSVISSDDGVNATATSGNAIVVSGGSLYVYAGGDGLDSNSTTSYGGILFSGGKTVVITASNGNSAIDSERGYLYTGGAVLAVTARGGMSSETTNCKELSSMGSSASQSLSSGNYVTVTVDSKTVVTVKMPCSMSATVVYLGSSGAKIASDDSTKADLDQNGVCWNLATAM